MKEEKVAADEAKAARIICEIRPLIAEIDGEERRSLEKHLRLGGLLNALKACAPHRQFGTCRRDIVNRSPSWCALLMRAARFFDSAEYDLALHARRMGGGDEPRTIEQLDKLRREWIAAQHEEEDQPDEKPQRRRKSNDDLPALYAALLIENGQLLAENRDLQTLSKLQRDRILFLEQRLAEAATGAAVVPLERLMLPYIEGAAMTI